MKPSGSLGIAAPSGGGPEVSEGSTIAWRCATGFLREKTYWGVFSFSADRYENSGLDSTVLHYQYTTQETISCSRNKLIGRLFDGIKPFNTKKYFFEILPMLFRVVFTRRFFESTQRTFLGHILIRRGEIGGRCGQKDCIRSNTIHGSHCGFIISTPGGGGGH